MLRPLAEMMPAVTVEFRLKGLPTASTHWPTFTSSELPYFMKGRLSAFTFSTARSVLGSAPTSSASNLRLSSSTTSILEAFSMTWLLVTMYPLAAMMTPEPEPCPPPRGCGPLNCSSWSPKNCRRNGSICMRRSLAGAAYSVITCTTAGVTASAAATKFRFWGTS